MVYVEHTPPPTAELPAHDFEPAKRRRPLPVDQPAAGRGKSRSAGRWFMVGALVGTLLFIIAAVIAWQRVNALFF